MSTEGRINWEQVREDSQDTLDAQNYGLLSMDETLVTAIGREYALDLETGNWVSTPVSGQIRVKDETSGSF